MKKITINIEMVLFIIYGIIAMIIFMGKDYLQNAIPLLLGVCFFYVKKYKFPLRIRRVILSFILLIIIQIFGLFLNLTLYSIRTIFISCTILLFIYILLCYKKSNNINFKFYYISTIIFCILILFSSIKIYGTNSIGGYLIFYFLNISVFIFINNDNITEERTIFLVMIGILFSIICTVLLSARTAMISGILFILFYIILYKFSKLINKKLFFIIVGSIFIITYIYINAKNYSWYTSLNFYSIKYFGKNIDSGRSYLWINSLGELKNIKSWLFGLGTGITPHLERYMGSSFHNSFIQMLMQNGMVGLFCIVLIFYNIWNNIILISSIRLKALFASVLFIILIYNCMETTLLQNKAILGILQWNLLTMGLICSRRIK